jgi:alkylation response protein AidB-like acyl-CoA dehydrogenase
VDADGRLTADKHLVDYGPSCPQHLVAANGTTGVALWLVAADAAGVHIERTHTIARTPQATVRYRAAAAEGVGSTRAFAELVRLGRTLAAVQCLGAAAQALEMTVAYVKGRVQFGRPIGSFQAVQHHCADMAIMVEATRFLVYELLWRYDAGGVGDARIALVKAQAGRAASEVTLAAHQLHGGIGVAEEYELHFFSRRATERSLAWGSQHESLLRVAETVERVEVQI